MPQFARQTGFMRWFCSWHLTKASYLMDFILLAGGNRATPENGAV
jgi:hypothetical protein